MTEFDRANPLFERDNVPFEIITCSGSSEAPTTSKRYGTFTVRILQGHRPPKNGSGEKERVIRFEMSDECNLLDDKSNERSRNVGGVPSHSSPGRRTFQYQVPSTSNIHIPSMMTDSVRGLSSMQIPIHQMGYSSSGRTLYVNDTQHLPIELYELEVGESDFSDLRRDQALLVDFHDFANSLISLLRICELGDDGNLPQPREENIPFETFHDSNQCVNPPCKSAGGWKSHNMNYNGQLQWAPSHGAWNTSSQAQQELNHQRQAMLHHGMRIPSPYGKGSAAIPVSTYACRLELNSPLSDESAKWRNVPKSNSTHARFSIVESNQFRELIHLALNLSIGTDKSVRLYLSLRLNQTMIQSRDFQSLLIDEQRRSDIAERELLSLKKMLQEVTQSTEAEKYQIRYQAEERIQTENSSRLAEVNELKAAKEAEIKALSEKSEKNRIVAENKIRLLEEVNAKVNSEKAATENENELLATKLSFQETANNTLADELSVLRSKLQHISEEKATVERSLHQLQMQLTSLEYSNTSKEKTLFQTEAQRVSAEKVSIDAQRILSNQHSQMVELQKRLEEAELETLKYKDLTSRYQTNRVEMKKRIKDKAEMIREQEDVFVVKEKEVTDLKNRVQGLVKELQSTKSEKEVLERELNDARRQIQDDKKKLENNQQVRSVAVLSVTLSASKPHFLLQFNSYQVIAWLNKQSSGGAQWNGAKTASSTFSPMLIPASTNSQVASLPRFMPSVGTAPYQRLYVTPDVKIVAGMPQQLHPEPTPYSGMLRRPDAANK